MPEYRRPDAHGAAIFFTVVTHRRRPIFTTSVAIEHLRQAFREEMAHHRFAIDGIVVLPDHIHTIWTLPKGDTRFSMRWTKIKGRFTQLLLASGGAEGPRNASRVRRGERGVWQRRFWDYVVRDEKEYEAFMDYIHWNPVKHGYADCPHQWPHSSFHAWVRRGNYAADWMCVCGERTQPRIDFEHIQRFTYDE